MQSKMITSLVNVDLKHHHLESGPISRYGTCELHKKSIKRTTVEPCLMDTPEKQTPLMCTYVDTF